MKDVLHRILMARGAAALFGMATTLVAVSFLPDREYVIASLVVAYSVVALSLLYVPFAKYILVAPPDPRISATFWKFQLPLFGVLLTLAMIAELLGLFDGVGVAVAGACFTASQGLKFFLGEGARVDRNMALVQRLYIRDGITTFVLTCVSLNVSAEAFVYLLATSASSAFWCLLLFRQRDGRIDLGGTAPIIRDVYRYAYGPVGSNVLNATALAIARTAIAGASPAGSAGTIQFLLDFLQKPLALIASSVNSAVVPIVARRPGDGSMVGYLNALLVIVLGAAIVAAVVLAEVVTRVVGGDGVGYVLAGMAAAFVWSNRYKTSVLDVSLTASTEKSWMLLAGATASLVLMSVLPLLGLTIEWVLSAATAIILFGGAINLLVANQQQLMPIRKAWSSVVVCLTLVGTSFFASIAYASR